MADHEEQQAASCACIASRPSLRVISGAAVAGTLTHNARSPQEYSVKHHRMKPREFFLFNDLLLKANRESDSSLALRGVSRALTALPTCLRTHCACEASCSDGRRPYVVSEQVIRLDGALDVLSFPSFWNKGMELTNCIMLTHDVGKKKETWYLSFDTVELMREWSEQLEQLHSELIWTCERCRPPPPRPPPAQDGPRPLHGNACTRLTPFGTFPSLIA
jgi:hypothetical protein